MVLDRDRLARELPHGRIPGDNLLQIIHLLTQLINHTHYGLLLATAHRIIRGRRHLDRQHARVILRDIFSQHFRRDLPLCSNSLRLEGTDCLRHILELPDVARPAIALQELYGIRGQHSPSHSVFLREIRGELSEQQMNIFLSLPKRRHVDGHRIEPVIEIFPELALRHGIFQVDIGCSHHPHICLQHLRRAHPDELSRLQDPQQFRLRSKRQLSHLVQEQGAAVRLFEISFPHFVCACK